MTGTSRFLIIDSSLAFTGAIKAAMEQAKMLSGDFEFHFLVPRGSSNTMLLKDLGYQVHELPMTELGRSPKKLGLYIPVLLANAYRLRKIIQQESIDIIQVNDYYNLLGAVVKMSGFKGKLITYVRLLPAAMPRPLSKFWIKIATLYSNHIITVSDAVKKQLIGHSKITRIYDPIFFESKHPGKEWKEDQQEINMLYLANFTRGKGQEHALNAFARAYAKNKLLRLQFAGGDFGLEKNKIFKKELEDATASMDLTDVITFSSFVQDIEALIKSADIVLNFSEAESFSMTVAEASFYGLPVIATRCGGPEEIIDDGVTGVLVNKGDIEQMTLAILDLAASGNKRKAMGAAAQSHVRYKFSPTVFKNEFTRIINSINCISTTKQLNN